MEKVPSFDMDTEDWELLPDEGLFRGKAKLPKEMSINPKGDADMDYFMCPSDPHSLLQSVDDLTIVKANWKQSTARDPTKTDQVPLKDFSDEELVKEEIKEINVVPSPPTPPVIVEDDLKSKVCHDKLEEQEIFADITNDTEKINEDVTHEQREDKYVCSVQSGRGCWDGFGINVWRWRFTGIGALCSIGMAAATICIFILGGQRQKHHHQNQKLQIQIYPDEKNLHQVVQHATRINQAMPAMRGVPVPRANISFGGYYNGL